MHIDHHAFINTRIQQIKTETAADPILVIVHQYTLGGWPTKRNKLSNIARHYWDQRDELSLDHGLLMKVPRIIIPTCQRERTLNNLNTSHKGITTMIEIAKKKTQATGWDKCKYRRLYKQMYSLPNDKEKQQHRTTFISPGTRQHMEKVST